MSTEPQINDEQLIDIGDQDESAVDIDLDAGTIIEENPNVEDQLVAADTPEGDEPPAKTEAEVAAEEREQYGEKVKKRIAKFTYDLKESERREQAALEYAQGVQAENVQLKSKQQHQDGVFINEHKGRLEAQLEANKTAFRDAHASGDPELIADANAQMSRTTAELTQAEQTETRFERFVKNTPRPEDTYKQYQPPAAERTQPAAPAGPDAKTEAWAEKNEWFGDDQEMTEGALSIHKNMVTNEGYLPTSDAYYEELDNRLRKNYPTKFKKPVLSSEQVVTPGAPVTGASKPRGKRTIRLTPSQVTMAKKLGVPLEEYAKYV